MMPLRLLLLPIGINLAPAEFEERGRSHPNGDFHLQNTFDADDRHIRSGLRRDTGEGSRGFR